VCGRSVITLYVCEEEGRDRLVLSTYITWYKKLDSAKEKSSSSSSKQVVPWRRWKGTCKRT
jgi:hypothetical protein